MTLPAFTGECFINGCWLKGGGPEFVSIASADGSEAWRGHEASAADVEAAIVAARAALPAWRRRPIDERIGLVRAFAKLVDARKADMAAVISRATGKPVWDAATEAAAMVGKAELSVKAYQERTPTKEAPAGAFTARISHHPHGVMAVLGPFNFPGHLPNGHIMPALIAGNTIIFKPSEQTPRLPSSRSAYGKRRVFLPASSTSCKAPARLRKSWSSMKASTASCSPAACPQAARSTARSAAVSKRSSRSNSAATIRWSCGTPPIWNRPPS
jgi:acyl-CoA reductase-like NAD-dependent aldehyde dehydrogenase